MPVKAIESRDIYASNQGSAHAARFDGTVYTSGILPKDPKGEVTDAGKLPEQAERVFRNLEAVLASGGARMQDVAKINIYVNPAAFSRLREIQEHAGKILRLDTVAGTIVPVTLPIPGALLSIEATAHIGVKRRVITGSSEAASEFGWANAVTAGETTYVSGRYGKGDPFLAQAKSVYDAFDGIIRDAGVNWRDVVRIHQFATRPDLSIDDLRAARAPYLRNTEFLSTSVVCHLPASPALSRAWQLAVDIEATTAQKVYSSTPGTWANPGGLHAVKAGGTAYFTAQMSRNDQNKTLFADDVVAHANQVCLNIDAMLAGAGVGWEEVVHGRVFCRDFGDLAAVRKVVDRWMKGGSPARTELVVGFFDPLASVEIEVTAAVP
jgi:2-iminobutanoate/2-iminopropanoate deaminase